MHAVASGIHLDDTEFADLDELVFHPWTVQGPRAVPTFVAAAGSYVIDSEGRCYLSFGSQLVAFTNLGHQHPRIVAAIKEQADRLCTLAPGYALRLIQLEDGLPRRAVYGCHTRLPALLTLEDRWLPSCSCASSPASCGGV